MRYLVVLSFSLLLSGQPPSGLGDLVDRLQASLAKNPNDENSAIQLLDRYAALTLDPNVPTGEVLESRRRLILSWIERSPDSRVLARPQACFDPQGPAGDSIGYAK